MSLTERRQLLSSLKAIVEARDNPALAEAIVNAVGAVGIDVALDYLKTQKIASALRDANAIEELRNLIEARVRALPGPDRVRLCVPLASGMSTHFISRPLKIGTFYFGRQATNAPIYVVPQVRDRPAAVPRPA